MLYREAPVFSVCVFWCTLKTFRRLRPRAVGSGRKSAACSQISARLESHVLTTAEIPQGWKASDGRTAKCSVLRSPLDVNNQALTHGQD